MTDNERSSISLLSFSIYSLLSFLCHKSHEIKREIIEIYSDKPKAIKITSGNDKESLIQWLLHVINDEPCRH
jgi:hypothetical protein